MGLEPSRDAGIPVSVKDVFDVAGDVTCAASPLLDEAPPATADAPVVAQLRAAGFVIVGRTNMTEFAYSVLGVNSLSLPFIPSIAETLEFCITTGYPFRHA